MTKGFILILLSMQDIGSARPDQMEVIETFQTLSECWVALQGRGETEGEAVLACLPE